MELYKSLEADSLQTAVLRQAFKPAAWQDMVQPPKGLTQLLS